MSGVVRFARMKTSSTIVSLLFGLLLFGLASCGSAQDTASAVTTTTGASASTTVPTTSSTTVTESTVVETTVADLAPDDQLLEALRNDDLAALDAAIANGADVDLDIGYPVVHLAAEKGSVDFVERLLEAGADQNVAGNNGHSALTRAAVNGHVDVMDLLIDAGADLDSRDEQYGRTIIMTVIDMAPNSDVVDLLIEAGSDLDAADQRGETALAAAAFMGRPELAQRLVDGGANVNVVNNDGVSPLAWAESQGNDAAATILRAAGAEG